LFSMIPVEKEKNQVLIGRKFVFQKRKKILLNLPQTWLKQVSGPPIGLSYLKSYLLSKLKNEIDIKIVDLSTWTDDKKIENLLKQEEPYLIGITTYSDYRSNVLKIASMAKKLNSKTIIVLGASHATSLYKQMLFNYPFLDYIVLGEGEITFCELVQKLLSNSSIEGIKGIAFTRGREVIKTPNRPLIKDLDILPYPDYEDFDMTLYKDYGRFDKKGVSQFCVVSSRSCPFKCNFCSSSEFWGIWRGRKPEEVVNEIEYVSKRYGLEYFSFNDDHFTLNKSRVIEICQAIVKRKLNLKWFVQSRVDSASLKVLEAMKEAGCQKISYGIDSGSPKILRNMNKEVNLEQIYEAYSVTKKVGIPTQMNIIVGYPGENEQTLAETKKVIKEIEPEGLLVSTLRLYPSTKVYDQAKIEGVVDDSFWIKSKDLFPYYTREYSKKRILEMQKDIYLYFYLTKGIRGILPLIRFVYTTIRRSPKDLWNRLRTLFFAVK